MLLSDCDINLKVGEKELRDPFAAMNLELREKLQIQFHFNPLNALHFGGEIRSFKAALWETVGSQHESGEMLHTVMVEIEGILNPKPIGCASSDIADPDPITPNLLLMWQQDASLPQSTQTPTCLDVGGRDTHKLYLIGSSQTTVIKQMVK